MATSRYRNSIIVDETRYETFESPDLSGIKTFNVYVNPNERLDHLAFKYLGAGEYWWIIAAINNLSWALQFESGQIIKIPVDLNEALQLF
jgi:hypothetical protein